MKEKAIPPPPTDQAGAGRRTAEHHLSDAAAQSGASVRQRLLHPVNEAAGLLGFSRSTIYKLNREGRLQIVRHGAQSYVTAAELQRFLVEEVQPLVPGTPPAMGGLGAEPDTRAS